MTNETIAPAVASTAVGEARTGARVAPERLSESIADAIGVHLDSADVKLRDHIPNSLTFLQMLLALEDEYGVTIDYGAMDPGVTVADLAAVIDAARGGADAGSAAGAAAGADPAVATGESDDGCAGKNGAGPADAVPLNPIQTAYLLGADEDIELRGIPARLFVAAGGGGRADGLRASRRAVPSARCRCRGLEPDRRVPRHRRGSRVRRRCRRGGGGDPSGHANRGAIVERGRSHGRREAARRCGRVQDVHLLQHDRHGCGFGVPVLRRARIPAGRGAAGSSFQIWGCPGGNLCAPARRETSRGPRLLGEEGRRSAAAPGVPGGREG